MIKNKIYLKVFYEYSPKSKFPPPQKNTNKKKPTYKAGRAGGFT